MTKPRTGQALDTMSREQFGERFRANFYDPAFEGAKAEIARLEVRATAAADAASFERMRAVFWAVSAWRSWATICASSSAARASSSSVSVPGRAAGSAGVTIGLGADAGALVGRLAGRCSGRR